MRARARGFTLVELMVTLLVVGIVLSVAVPSFTSMIASQKVKAAASTLQFAMLSTRSEALKRNASVILAPVTPGDWTSGWTISWTDPVNGLQTLASGGPVTGATITGPGTVFFRSSGRLASGSSTTPFKFSSTHTSDIRCLAVSLSGVPSITSSGC